ncbi:hydroxyacid dehydrogenase, partial [Xanthomonas citri pv. citri]|nr:hydroxyacid dehydrogenase [Xanthomonas citri pv. citri]
LDEVLPGAQVVMIAAAATEETRGMVDADRLALLDEDAVLVNVARGALVDTDAVVQALAAGRLHGYGTDVTDPEPLPDGHPLWTEERALITPHTADTPEMCVPLLHARVERNLRARAAGTELEGLVDAEGGY